MRLMRMTRPDSRGDSDHMAVTNVSMDERWPTRMKKFLAIFSVSIGLSCRYDHHTVWTQDETENEEENRQVFGH